jgi:hypothetical protein
MVMNTIKVPFNGKGHQLSYQVETIDLNTEGLQFLNVYTVFVEDEPLQKLLGAQFTILHNHLNHPQPAFEIKSSGNIEEKNLKKQIAQQVINNPTE